MAADRGLLARDDPERSGRAGVFSVHHCPRQGSRNWLGVGMRGALGRALRSVESGMGFSHHGRGWLVAWAVSGVDARRQSAVVGRFRRTFRVLLRAGTKVVGRRGRADSAVGARCGGGRRAGAGGCRGAPVVHRRGGHAPDRAWASRVSRHGVHGGGVCWVDPILPHGPPLRTVAARHQSAAACADRCPSAAVFCRHGHFADAGLCSLAPGPAPLAFADAARGGGDGAGIGRADVGGGPGRLPSVRLAGLRRDQPEWPGHALGGV